MIPKILDVVWGDQEGYVCISTLDRLHSKGSWEDHIFEWPTKRKAVSRCVDEYLDTHEIYWAPMVFSGPRRDEKLATPNAFLWADLDPVPPSRCLIKPSIAWESSPGRYQCIWLLDEPIDRKDHDELNKRMTYAVGADKSGWDITQVLRLPGTTNHKYVEKPPVKLMYLHKTKYDPQELAEQLPSTVKGSDLIDVDDLDIELNELKELVWPYRKFLGPKMWELLFAPDSTVDDEDRSARLWELECRLLESGLPVIEVVKIAKACPWNKFRDRPDEDKRIFAEVLKAEKQVRGGAIVISQDLTPVNWEDYSHFMGKPYIAPGWMIENIWGNNSHGIIAGEPKTYKSTICIEMAIAVASGLPMWDMYKTMRTGPVMYLQDENPPWMVQDRFQRMCHSKGLLDGKVYTIHGNKNNLHIQMPRALPIRFLNNYGFDLTLTEHREMLMEEIERFRPVMIIFDPLYLMLGDTDENSAKELRDTLKWLLKLKIDYNCSIVVLHHWNKGGGQKTERGGQRMLGSTTFHAWVDSAIYTSVNDVDENRILIEREFRSFVKPHLLTMKVKSDKDTPYEAIVQRFGDEKVEKMTPELLLEFIIGQGKVTIKEMIAYTNYTGPGLRKILDKLVYNQFVREDGKGVGRGNSRYYTATPLGVKFNKDWRDGKVTFS